MWGLKNLYFAGNSNWRVHLTQHIVWRNQPSFQSHEGREVFTLCYSLTSMILNWLNSSSVLLASSNFWFSFLFLFLSQRPFYMVESVSNHCIGISKTLKYNKDMIFFFFLIQLYMLFLSSWQIEIFSVNTIGKHISNFQFTSKLRMEIGFKKKKWNWQRWENV